MISDLVRFAIPIEKVFFWSVIVICRCTQLDHLSTRNIILSSKTSPLSMDDSPFRQAFKLGIFISTAEKSILNLVKL